MISTALGLLLLYEGLAAFQNGTSPYPAVSYSEAQSHEIKPHRRMIPVAGVSSGFNQLHLTLVVSPTGDVMRADATGSDADLKCWPGIQGEVGQWRFTPFERDGKAATVQVEEYLDIVPPERLPKKHLPAPVVRPDSQVSITLERTACLGSCPSYRVAITTSGIVFEGESYVVAAGRHTDMVDPDEVRALAKRFVGADFYSMDEEYSASVTDAPTHVLTVAIDGHSKKVLDYMGFEEGMPAVVSDLEEEVDAAARTLRWVAGADGLVSALQAEDFDFRTSEAQMMLKKAATRGATTTVRDLVGAGVPLILNLSPNRGRGKSVAPLEAVGWLTSASHHRDALRVLILAGASRDDQQDKDLALIGAAESGDVEAAKELIEYGAKPNADLSKLTITESGGAMTLQHRGSGTVLIYAAKSGNPAMIRLLLQYEPKLEAGNWQGKTAMFAAGDYRYGDQDGARVECVRVLAEAGANVNARDRDGNTPLHETFLTDVEEELLKLGANVNARNKEGETPIFTTVDNDAIPLFIQHGADITIRNNKGETVMEAAKDKGPLRQEALRKAVRTPAEAR